MNLILVEPADIDEHGRVMLTGRRAAHIVANVRANVGDELRIAMVRGRRGVGQVLRVHDRSVLLEPRWRDAPERVPGVDLVLAMPRPKALARVLQTAASMGVRRIDIVNAWRVDKSYLSSPELAADRMRANLMLGCEQGGCTWVPDLAVHRLLMPFLRGPLHEHCRRGHAVIAHPRQTQYIEDVVVPGDREHVTVAVGPERGWIDRELESFAALGFVPVSLGEQTLRVEVAVSALLAQLSLLQRL